MNRFAFFTTRFKLAAYIFGILVSAFAGNEHAVAAAQKDWITLENCQFVEDPSNDGDSFHIRSNGTEYLIRLYLVDAPETASVAPARLIEQAQYFGVTVPQVIEIGEAAKLFVQGKLAQPFKVQTRKATGMGRSKIERFYGFVETKDGDLGEQLVANGLARVHGMRAAPPGAPSSEDTIHKLEDLEQKAKQAKLGAWAGNTRPNPPSPDPSAIASPSLPVSSAAPSTSVSVAPREPVPSTKKDTTVRELDINTATVKELRNIPGIGPVMARRIIDSRPFTSADDLRKVNGIGEKTYAKIRPFFR
jgi:competence ComEA-like helix-hairpin-helix protein